MNKEHLEEEYPVGCLVEFSDIDYEQREILIKLMSKEYSYLFQVLYTILEDDALTLRLIDIFADKKIRFPSRKKIYKTLEKIRIYNCVKKHKYSDTYINALAKQYNKKPSQVRILVNKINDILNSDYNLNKSSK